MSYFQVDVPEQIGCRLLGALEQDGRRGPPRPEAKIYELYL